MEDTGMKQLYMTVLITASALLGACTIFDKDLGASVNANTQAQVVDAYAGFGEEVATLDGQKAEKLLNEYRREKAAAPTERLLMDVGN
jgi:hypothetical protein